MTDSSGQAARWGAKAERAAARKFGLERVGGKWYDAKYRSNGRKTQIKACRATLASGQTGRCRFWKNDHTLLKQHHGSYVVVVYRPSGIVRIEKVSTATVGRLANWYNSGHKGRRKNQQSKLKWTGLL